MSGREISAARAGGSGPHAGTESFYPAYYGKLAIFSWFNAGTRVFDIRNPFEVREIALLHSCDEREHDVVLR